MTQLSNKTVVAALLITLALWGCSRSGPDPKVQAERIQSLEERLAKMESDYQAIIAHREELLGKVTALEDKLVLHKKVVQERDELRNISEQRKGERDALQIRCEMFKRGLQELIGQDESMISLGRPSAVTVTAGLPIPGK